MVSQRSFPPRMNRGYKFIVVFLISFSLSGCGGKDPSPLDDNTDRTAILENWVDNLVIPSYDIFKVKLDVMSTKADAFTAAPTLTTLAELREAWVDAYIEWQNVELFEFGPADQVTLRNFFNIYPADVAGIQSNIQTPSANLEVPAAYARQGFPALDYLINGLAGTDSDIVALYTTDPAAASRIAYLNKLTDRMTSLVDGVVASWPSYRETFISSTGLDIGSSMGLVVNAYVLQYERFVRSGKIGIPSGAMVVGGGTPQPERVEAYYKKDISATLLATAHQAAWRFFNGTGRDNGAEGPSFKSYLDALGATDSSTGTALSAIISEQFEIVSTKAEALPENLHDLVITDNEQMLETFSEMQKLVRLLKVDMTSAMSVTITYTDNDGD